MDFSRVLLLLASPGYHLPPYWQSVYEYRQRYGPINNINNLLEVKGISAQPAMKLCNAILKTFEDCPAADDFDKARHPTGKKIDVHKTKSGHGSTFTQKYLSQDPPLAHEFSSRVVAINIIARSICWAVLEKKDTWKFQTLVTWGYYDVPETPVGKLDFIHEIFRLQRTFPKEAAYVIRNVNSGRLGSTPLTDQLYGIVLSLMCSEQGFSNEAEKRIWTMKSEAPGKIFDLTIGGETISVEGVVKDLVTSSNLKFHSRTTILPKLVDSFSKLHFDEKCVNYFLEQNDFHREVMTRALLIAKAFVELLDFSEGNNVNKDN